MNYILPSYTLPLTTKGMYSSLTSTTAGLSASGNTIGSSSNSHIISASSSSLSSSNSGGVRNFSCEICHKTFPRQGNLDRHRRTHDGDRPFSCDLCPKAFSQRSHLKVHRNTHTGEQTFKCHVCGYCFSRNGNLTRHMRTHQKQKVFANENLYNRNGHSDPEPKVAAKVHYRAIEKAKPNLQNYPPNPRHHHHQHHHHHHSHNQQQHQRQQLQQTHQQPQQQRSYKCTICSKSFIPSRQQGGVTLYCDSCWKDLTSDTSLPPAPLPPPPPHHPHVHLNHEHHKSSPFQHPGKSTKRLISAAAAAAALHKYQCQLCGRTFPRNGNLERHKSAHLGLKPFGCDICGRMFGQKSHAKVHKMIHTGERPYKCDVCGFSFSRNGNLARHKRFNKFSCLVPGTSEPTRNHQSGHHYRTINTALPSPLPPLPRLPPPSPTPPLQSQRERHVSPSSEGIPNTNAVGRAEENVVVIQVGAETQQLEPVSNTQIASNGSTEDVDHVDNNILNTPQMPNSSVE